MNAFLALEDGTLYAGESVGVPGETHGTVVCVTGVVGYQETMTDPSSRGQLLVFTYPEIGNTGVRKKGLQSEHVQAGGVIFKEASPVTSSWQAEGSFNDFLIEHGVMAIQGIDTRAVAVHLRQHGEMRGIISTVDSDPKSLRAKIQRSPSPADTHPVDDVTPKEIRRWGGHPATPKGPAPTRLVVLDLGARGSFLSALVQRGFEVISVPAQTAAADILTLKPQGVVLSSGPGDPRTLPHLVETSKKLLGKVPLFGIGLGHLVLGLALGADTQAMHVGHHSDNQPVRDLVRGRLDITSQHHSFVVAGDESASGMFEITHRNVNDGSIEGFRTASHGVISIQYYPRIAGVDHVDDAWQEFEHILV